MVTAAAALPGEPVTITGADGWTLHVDLTIEPNEIMVYDQNKIPQFKISGRISRVAIKKQVKAFAIAHGQLRIPHIP